MPLVLRRTTSVPLTNEQMDGNFEYLDTRISTLEGRSVTIPTATNTVLGGVKVGSGLSINSSGTLTNTGVTKIIAGSNVTITPSTGVGEVTISASGGSGGGSYQQGTGITISGTTISANIGTGSTQVAAGNHTHATYAFTSGTGISIAADKSINLQAPTSTTIGGVRAGANITISADGVISSSGGGTGGTTYTQGDGINISNTTISAAFGTTNNTVARGDHTHSGYALSTHTHTGYAAATHTHTDYAAATHTHTGYAAATHTHSNYATSDHTHSGYATSTHTHNEYALISTLNKWSYAKAMAVFRMVTASRSITLWKSQNIASIVYEAMGKITVNFTANTFADPYYVVVGQAAGQLELSSSNHDVHIFAVRQEQPTVNKCLLTFQDPYADTSAGQADSVYVTLAFIAPY